MTIAATLKYGISKTPATASAAITTIGGKVLRRIRATLLRRGTLLILFGANENALEYGRSQISRLHRCRQRTHSVW